MSTNVELKSNYNPNAKLIIKSTLPPNIAKKKPIKKISFSSLNLDNSNSFNGVQNDFMGNSISRISKISNDDKPHSYYNFSEINKRTNNFNKSLDFSQLPAYFIDERKASVDSKIEMHRKIMGKN